MTRREAVAGAAIQRPPLPVRHKGGGAAEFGQLPRAARGAHTLEGGRQEHAADDGGEQPETPSASEGKERAEGPDHGDSDNRHQHASQGTCTVMQDMREEPGLAGGKARGRAGQTRQRDVLPEEVPGQDGHQAQEGGHGGRVEKAQGTQGISAGGASRRDYHSGRPA